MMQTITGRRASSRSFFISVVISIALGLASFQIASLISKKAHAKESRPSRPVSVHYTIQQFDPTGKLAFAKSRHYSRFDDGSIANTFDEISPEPQPLITEILNATTGSWLYLDPVTKSSITFERSPARVQRAISQADTEGCPSGADLGKLLSTGSILGVKVVYYANKEASGDLIEKWMAPELDCLPLKEIDTSPRHAGARNVEVATFVSVGEPSEDLKSAPPSYVERFPEVVEEMHISATGGKPLWGNLALRAIKRHYSAEGLLARR